MGTPPPMAVVLVIGVVSGSLVVGSLLGISGRLSDTVIGFVVALAGGALLVSASIELFEPASEVIAAWLIALSVGAGAIGFSALDWFVDETWGGESGGGLLAAITLDGLPENLALGVALIGTGPLGAAALSGSILLSNLPEAAGGAKQMSDDGRSRAVVVGLWTATAVLLSIAALVGYFFLSGVAPGWLAAIRCFAGGAVVASLATEVFPQAYRQDSYAAGVATAVGAVLAITLSQMGS